MRICPRYNYFVSVFSCFQCDCFELHNKRTAEVIKKAGACHHPESASKESRAVTDAFCRSLGFKNEKKERKDTRRRGGMNDKKEFIEELLQQGAQKEEVMQELSAKYPEMSAAYQITLYYQVRKKIKGKAEALNRG